MDYKLEIKKMLARIPAKVINGSTNQAVDYKNVVEKAAKVSRKSRPSEAELVGIYSELKLFE